ncbi:hypothetical protein GCM10011371_08440 [Novosphingobium marinum]|uniref:Uncharacterized protein n=1 Tax=Novosphingobium marinum TaxID=1514948 RepID=A0A7Y9XU78_9SPHN|nr:hypothetical protein [Novosphingobium marinum]NYH94532.1 hypothetical protein [Novosphingobium marinum]GGC23053.1 hypothetical protein GCM10011371_08440 [Novosphingobium marinum]
MAKSIGERVNSALTEPRTRAADIEALIPEVTAERDRLAALAEQASGDAVNFGLGESDRDEASAKADKARREAEMLCRAIDQLGDRLGEKLASETRKTKERERADVIAERDALAARLRSEWPEIEAKIVELLTAVRANDERMRAAGVYEASAEAEARGCDGMFRVGVSSVRRLTEMKLPSFDRLAELAWPPPARIDSYALDLEDIRAKQLEAAEKARLAELASWKPHRFTTGFAHQSGHYIEVKTKLDPSEPTPTVVPIYNTRRVHEDPAETYEYLITAATAERLRGLGFTVERIDALGPEKVQ